jgi:hypothetical protein
MEHIKNIAYESGNLPEECVRDAIVVYTLKEFKEQLIETMSIPDHLVPFIDWVHLVETVCRESDRYCILNGNADGEWEATSSIDEDYGVYICEAREE